MRRKKHFLFQGKHRRSSEPPKSYYPQLWKLNAENLTKIQEQVETIKIESKIPLKEQNKKLPEERLKVFDDVYEWLNKTLKILEEKESLNREIISALVHVNSQRDHQNENDYQEQVFVKHEQSKNGCDIPFTLHYWRMSSLC